MEEKLQMFACLFFIGEADTYWESAWRLLKSIFVIQFLIDVWKALELWIRTPDDAFARLLDVVPVDLSTCGGFDKGVEASKRQPASALVSSA